MRKKLILSYIALLVIMVLAFTFIIEEALIESVKTQYEGNIVDKLMLSKQLLESKPEEQSLMDFSRNLNETTGLRATIVDTQGVVLAETDKSPENMTNHINREEIKEALQSKSASVKIRYSNTIKADYIYAAIPAVVHGENLVLRISSPMLELSNMVKKALNYSVLVLVIIAGFAIAMAVLISNRITEPIYKLTKVAQNIASGQYEEKIYVQSKDQIGLLSEAFNTMTQNLKQSIFELSNRNIQLESILNSMINGVIAIDANKNILMINKMSFEILELPDGYVAENESMYKIVRNEEVAQMIENAIDEGRSQIKELPYVHLDKVLRIYVNPIRTHTHQVLGGIVVIQDVTQVRKLEQMRSEFVSNVSHELKTPLTSIKGFVETLKNGAVQDPLTALRFLEIIDIESDRLYRLINDILSLSEIERMDRERETVSICINDVVDEVVTMLQLKAEEKQIELLVDMEKPFFLEANRDRIKQMLINLMDNAIKYTERGHVLVTIKQKTHFVQITVADTGVGFDEVHKERVFERFYRADKGRSRAQGGTGLGLSIVKHIVLLYNGKISVKSTPGIGTQFDILFPQKASE